MENDNSTTDNVCYKIVIGDNNTATNNTSVNSELMNGKNRQ